MLRLNDNVWKVNPDLDRLQSLNPFFASGDTWLISRKHLSLTITNKNLKVFFNQIEQVGEKLGHFLNDSLRKNNNVIELELHSLAYKYTIAVASVLGFSVEDEYFDDKDSHSISFNNIVEKVLGKNFSSLITQTLNFYFYDLNKFLRQRFIPKEVDRFFSATIKKITHVRQQEESARKFDFLQLMLDLKENKAIDDDIVASHVLTFFINVIDTSSVTLSFAAYQLARHPHVQQKLRNEVKSVLAKYNDRLTYDAVKEMTYMDQVLQESQRIYPTVTCLGKVCTEEFELTGSDGLSCRIHPGTNIFINIYEMHTNPKYWPNPNVFDPDRFAFDRKTEIDNYVFLPFGGGKRICVARQLALLQIKVYLATIVKNYTLELSPKTAKELFKFMPGKFLTVPTEGLWVNFKPL